MSDTTTQCHKFSWCLMRHGHRGECSSIFYTSTGDPPSAGATPVCTCTFHLGTILGEMCSACKAATTTTTPASDPLSKLICMCGHAKYVHTRKGRLSTVACGQCPNEGKRCEFFVSQADGIQAAPPTLEPTGEQKLKARKWVKTKLTFSEMRSDNERNLACEVFGDYCAEYALVSSSKRVRELEQIQKKLLSGWGVESYCKELSARAEAAEAQVKDLTGKLTALRILLEARSWGAALAAIAEAEPELCKLVDEHDDYILRTNIRTNTQENK